MVTARGVVSRISPLKLGSAGGTFMNFRMIAEDGSCYLVTVHGGRARWFAGTLADGDVVEAVGREKQITQIYAKSVTRVSPAAVSEAIPEPRRGIFGRVLRFARGKGDA